MARGQIAPQRLPSLAHVANLWAVLGGLVERRLGDALIGNRDIETVAKSLQRSDMQVVDLMGHVLPLARFPRSVPLHGLGQNHHGLPLVGDGFGISGVDFRGIVAAPVEAPDIRVAHVRDHLAQFWVFPEKMLPGIGAATHLVGLILPIDDFFHALAQDAVLVLGEQRVPIAAPYQLNDSPARTPKTRFEFLNDLSIAPHGTIEPLQIAIDHENQVVETLPPRQGNRAQTFGFVGFTVAQERPNLSISALGNPPILEVFHKARLVDGRQRAKPHGDRGELPEIWH